MLNFFRIVAFFLVVFFFFTGNSFAQNITMSSDFNECYDNPNGSMRVMCLEDELLWQDERLNTVYKQLMAIETEPRKDMLRTSQRTWIKYKEEWNKYVSDLSKGEDDDSVNESILYTSVRITALQADNLQNILDTIKFMQSN
jgi:uncharacterized protein YecT (DUF1311 family)